MFCLFYVLTIKFFSLVTVEVELELIPEGELALK